MSGTGETYDETVDGGTGEPGRGGTGETGPGGTDEPRPGGTSETDHDRTGEPHPDETGETGTGGTGESSHGRTDETNQGRTDGSDHNGSAKTAGRIPRGFRVGRWEVTEPIADGGWGQVYEGREASEDAAAPAEAEAAEGGAEAPHRVALKFLPTSGLAPRQAARLAETARREIEFGSRAHHPRLMRLLDSVVLGDSEVPGLDGAVVLVMERAESSLQDLLDAADGNPLPEADRLVTEICEGLAHLHRLGWVHGDLKPDNVLIMADGSVRLSDFGLTVELEGTRGTHGYIPPLGSPDYLPPERWRAPLDERGVQVRPTADVWALGVMIHQVFSGGASPFPGATFTSRASAVQEYAEGRAPLRLHVVVPEFWRTLAADCLLPAHVERAAHTADSLLERIRAAGQGDDSPAARPRSRKRAVALAAGAALALLGAGGGAWWQWGGSDGGSGRAPEARLSVYNADDKCRASTDRHPLCSLGLAIDPTMAYVLDNVVQTRVWHGDVLAVECGLERGIPITDEAGVRSSRWYRVRLPTAEKGAETVRTTAWLPEVRTRSKPSVPACAG
ncbi:serine/threonine-protein kinase [Streptomyces sp. NBC_00620]|uniref:serine/threonine-protein kinase n=1 Tax=Streptomyces sp. NBC_00620 TaxID=2903666 RepID=UPI002B1D062E|nr:serine/threonine-protein kinase [Streptomyces sp. NBC_00620]